MPVNALAPEPRNAMLRPYEPSWKEQIAAYLMGNTRPSPERRQFATGIADILGYLPGTGNVLQGQEAARAGDTKGAIMAMLPLPGANVAARAEQAIAQDVAKGIRAYHGTPHDFPRFDITKIGTGEGAQVYGHGLYFAEHEPVALQYRNELSYPKYKGATLQELMPPSADVSKVNPQNEIIAEIMHDIKFEGMSPAEAVSKIQQTQLKYAQDAMERFKSAPAHMKDKRAGYVQKYIEGTKFARTLNPEDFVPTKGHMYEVNIKANPEDFLDWHTPLGEQKAGKELLDKMNPELRAELEDRLDRAGYSPDLSAFNGQELHSLLVKHTHENSLMPDFMEGGQKEVAAYLQSQGIPGIRYQDAGSRGAANKTFNYVVNDDKLVEIMRKYGLMGPIGAGIAAKILARQEQRQDM
jgi:hypothetical protein